MKMPLLKLVKYGFFGVVTTLLNIIAFKILITFHMDYKFATSIAWIISILFSYVTNKYWVFESAKREIRIVIKEFVKFVVGRGVTYIVDIVGLVILVSFFKMELLLSKVLINILVIILNYFFTKFALTDKNPEMSRID